MVRTEARASAEALNLMASDTGGRAILDNQAIEEGWPASPTTSNTIILWAISLPIPRTIGTVPSAWSWSTRRRTTGSGSGRDTFVSPTRKRSRSPSFTGFSRRANTDPLEVIVQTLPLKPLPGTDKQQLTLKLLIPIRKLMLSPKGDVYSGRIRVYLALKDRSNEISPCYLLSHDVKIPAADYAQAQRSSYPYVTEMNVDKTLYTISLAVEDVPGETISYIQFEKEIR